MESGIYLRDGSSTEEAKSAGRPRCVYGGRVSHPLVLGVGTYIAHSLSGLSNPPSVAAVMTTIVIVPINPTPHDHDGRGDHPTRQRDRCVVAVAHCRASVPPIRAAVPRDGA
jgi:hypothetical protein